MQTLQRKRIGPDHRLHSHSHSAQQAPCQPRWHIFCLLLIIQSYFEAVDSLTKAEFYYFRPSTVSRVVSKPRGHLALRCSKRSLKPYICVVTSYSMRKGRRASSVSVAFGIGMQGDIMSTRPTDRPTDRHHSKTPRRHSLVYQSLAHHRVCVDRSIHPISFDFYSPLVFASRCLY